MLGPCKEYKIDPLEDKCPLFWERCHYKKNIAFINMGSMLRQDYARLAIFEGLDGNQIHQLAPFLVECQFHKGFVVFEQGQPAEHLFILLGGEVLIHYKPYDGPSLNVARIEPGGVFGWSAALRHDVYTSRAVAAQDSAALCMRGASLPVICAKYPETGNIWLEHLASVIAQRLQSTHAQVLELLRQGMAAQGCAGQRKLMKRSIRK